MRDVNCAGELLDEVRGQDEECFALEHLETMIPCLERALADAKLARSLKGTFDGERSGVAVVYRRTLWWLGRARQVTGTGEPTP